MQGGVVRAIHSCQSHTSSNALRRLFSSLIFALGCDAVLQYWQQPGAAQLKPVFRKWAGNQVEQISRPSQQTHSRHVVLRNKPSYSYFMSYHHSRCSLCLALFLEFDCWQFSSPTTLLSSFPRSGQVDKKVQVLLPLQGSFSNHARPDSRVNISLCDWYRNVTYRFVMRNW